MAQQVLSLISILFCFSAFSQKAEVKLSASSTNIEVGETVAFTIESNIDGTHQIDNIPVTFINSGTIASGRSYQMDYNTGNVEVIYSNTETGVFTKPGTYKIGPAYITSRSGKAYQSTSTITINVSKKINLNNNGQVTAKQRNDPAFGIIQCNKTSIYEGESVVVGAKVYAHFQPTRIGNYNSFIQRKGLEFQALTNTSRQLKIHNDDYKGVDYFSFEYDRNLLFPPGTGVFILEPFTMDLFKGFGAFSLRSSGATIEIKPLPGNPPKDFIGAVGNYSISRDLDTFRVKQGDVFLLTLEIEGSGNIQNSLEPELILPKGFVVYGDPIVTKDIAYGVNGAEGVIAYEYNIQVSNKGKINIPGTSISFFDPEKEEYVTVTTTEHSLDVLRDPSIIAADSKNPAADEAIYKQSAVDLRLKKQVVSTESIFGTPLFWSGVSAPLVCAFFFLFLVRRREQSADEIETKQAIQQKDKELGVLVATSKSLLTAGEDDAFYSSIEHALRKAFECKMGITDSDRILGKDEIYAYLDTVNKPDLTESVRGVFRMCEESRFGFGGSTDRRLPVFSQLESILKDLKV
ncbi:MAG: BatD family protein [Crocinitomicaceae bacterium]|nr:BatD family protein [Crocinitomicaceae bacterium]